MSPATQPVRTLIPTALGPSISAQVKDHEVKAVHKLQVWMTARMVHPAVPTEVPTDQGPVH